MDASRSARSAGAYTRGGIFTEVKGSTDAGGRSRSISKDSEESEESKESEERQKENLLNPLLLLFLLIP